jgi:DNA polymerase III epsilon subunit-like protein
MTDVMVDIETTGTDPYHNAMVQLAAIEFNYETEEIGRTFNRSLLIPKGRYWDEDCRNNFWAPKWDLFTKIMSTAQPANEVMQDFFDWAKLANCSQRFWSRGNFDYWFVQTYLERIDLPMPFSPFTTRDLRTFLAGLFGKADEPNMKWLTMPGDAHNALFDCVIQLKRLFSAKNGVFYEILPPEENAA